MLNNQFSTYFQFNGKSANFPFFLLPKAKAEARAKEGKRF